MRKIVEETFRLFTIKHEGFTSFMYCDVLNLVTTGIGNLIDAGPNNNFPGATSLQRARLNTEVSARAMAPAMNLPWKHKAAGWTKSNPVTDNNLASQAEIAANWTLVKRLNAGPGSQDFSQRGGFAYANVAGNDLSLDMDGITQLFNRVRDNFNGTLVKRYPGFESWPADAQLATLSMAWALGPAFNFPAFKAAVDRLDFRQAGELSFFKGGGGTLEKRAGRNAENVIMFNNAADVVKGGVDPDRLFFPGTVATSPGVLPSGVNPDPPKQSGTGGLAVANLGTGTLKLSNPRIGQAATVAVGAAGLGAVGWGGWELYKFYTKGKRR